MTLLELSSSLSGGILRYKMPMGMYMCRWMGSHFPEWIGSEKCHLPTACWSYSPEERKEKSCCLCACYLIRVINGKVIEDEAIYNFWRFLVEDFFLPVIKPPGTYFNDKLLPSCRSSKFSSFFPCHQRSFVCSAGSNSSWQKFKECVTANRFNFS